MSIISVAAAREHLGVGDETSDAQLTPLIAAAEAALSDFLGRSLDEGPWSGQIAVPDNVIHAAKLILAELFDNRTTPIEEMAAVRALCGRYQRINFS